MNRTFLQYLLVLAKRWYEYILIIISRQSKHTLIQDPEQTYPPVYSTSTTRRITAAAFTYPGVITIRRTAANILRIVCSNGWTTRPCLRNQKRIFQIWIITALPISELIDDWVSWSNWKSLNQFINLRKCFQVIQTAQAVRTNQFHPTLKMGTTWGITFLRRSRRDRT